MSETLGYLHSIETFGSVDGPGVRFVIFLSGCHLRCQFCHNPDSWKLNTNQPVTVNELLDKAERYRAYWGKEGGITVSGGEPLLQIDFLTELFREAKKRKIHTCIDTALEPFSADEDFLKKFDALMEVTDLLLCDIKCIDPEVHKKLTGKGNENILQAFEYLNDIGKPIWIRHVLVPGLTDDDELLHKTRAFIDALQNVQRVEVLPYHTLGVYKWQELGLAYPLEGVKPPTEERIKNAEKILVS